MSLWMKSVLKFFNTKENLVVYLEIMVKGIHSHFEGNRFDHNFRNIRKIFKVHENVFIKWKYLAATQNL